MSNKFPEITVAIGAIICCFGTMLYVFSELIGQAVGSTRDNSILLIIIPIGFFVILIGFILDNTKNLYNIKTRNIEDDNINELLDKELEKHRQLTIKTDGVTCQKCGIVQGAPSNGFKKFYCKHSTECVDSKLNSSIIGSDVW